MSAPDSSGRCNKGVAKVLSTTKSTLSGMLRPSVGRSATSIVGLAGDSIHTTSASSAAAKTSVVSAMLTRRTCPPYRRGSSINGLGNAEIAVVRDHDDATGRYEFQHGMRRRHARGKGQCAPTLQGADRLLQSVPGRVAVSAVSDLGGTSIVRADVGGGKDHRRVEWGIHDSFRAARNDCQRFGMQQGLAAPIRSALIRSGRLLGHCAQV